MISDYQIIKKMADAIYGNVWLAKPRSPNSDALVAIKEMDLALASTRQEKTSMITVEEDAFMERESNRLLLVNASTVRTQNVVKLLDDFEEDGKMYLVFEYCAKGELFDQVAEKTLANYQALKYFRQICHGVEEIHGAGLAHRDLSLENVLVDANDVAKICDFGLASKASRRNNRVGKLYYMAPEVYQGKLYKPMQADMWSLGVMLLIMLVGRPPMEKASPTDSRYLLVQSKGITALLNLWHIKLTESALDLITKLIVVNPEDRITIEQVQQHPWVNGFDKLKQRDMSTGGLNASFKKSEKRNSVNLPAHTVVETLTCGMSKYDFSKSQAICFGHAMNSLFAFVEKHIQNVLHIKQPEGSENTCP